MDTDGIQIPASEVDTSGVFYFELDGPVKDAPETTNLFLCDKFKEDPTTEILYMKYKYVHTPFSCS